MKKFLKSTLGFCLSAVVINSCWNIFVDKFGVWGGWISALILTGTMWFVNHHIGLVENKEEAIFIDMGLAIGISSLFRDTIIKGIAALVSSFPTFICVIIGGTLAGVLVGSIKDRR